MRKSWLPQAPCAPRHRKVERWRTCWRYL